MSNITPSSSDEFELSTLPDANNTCAFCANPVSATAEDLRWAGWRRRGSYWVCPDCIGDQA